ncbi:hypothetical protein UlMin_012377 [Ulmus minor]
MQLLLLTSTLMCGHCKKLAPEYEKLGASFKKAKSVLIGKVDCDEHKDICSKYGISGYHTIQWFPKGSLEPKMYEGARTAEALVEYVNKEGGMANVKIDSAPSSVVVLSTDNLDEIVLNNILQCPHLMRCCPDKMTGVEKEEQKEVLQCTVKFTDALFPKGHDILVASMLKGTAICGLLV